MYLCVGVVIEIFIIVIINEFQLIAILTNEDVIFFSKFYFNLLIIQIFSIFFII